MSEEKKQRGTILYHSNLLNKNFDNYEDLVNAEEEFETKNAEKLRLTEEKKARAEEVQNAFLEYQQAQEKAFKEISEAEKKWVSLREKFAKDYNGYHMTYSNNNGKKIITFGDLFDDFFTKW